MKSMTGFGKSVCELPDKKVSVEIRSLNSKQLDLNLRTHTLYRDKEPELRQLLSRTLERGKIDFSIFVETGGENETSAINHTRKLPEQRAPIILHLSCACPMC
jgi:uncharacterized protein (TIGR00255 family)